MAESYSFTQICRQYRQAARVRMRSLRTPGVQPGPGTGATRSGTSALRGGSDLAGGELVRSATLTSIGIISATIGVSSMTPLAAVQKPSVGQEGRARGRGLPA